MKKVFAGLLFMVDICFLLWAISTYPNLLFSGTVVFVIAMIFEWILKKNKNQNIYFVIFGLAMVLLVYSGYKDPSFVAFVRVSEANATNFWHTLASSFAVYFVYLSSYWAWKTLEISEFLTKKRL